MRIRTSLLGLAFAALLASACGDSGQINGAVLMTIRFADAVPEATIDRAANLRIEVSGAETFSTTEPLATQLRDHQSVTVRYRPRAGSGQLNLLASAHSASGEPLGSGTAHVAIAADRESSVTILLGAVIVDFDMGHSDLTVTDGGQDAASDASTPDLQMPDLQMPDLQMPDLQMPDLQMPDLQMPDLQMPDLQMPDLKPMCANDNNCMKSEFCSTAGVCKAKLGGGGNCTGEGDHACVTSDCQGGTICGYCPKDQVYLAPGTVAEGSLMTDANASADEVPQHNVTFANGLCVDKTEVTVAAWRACVAKGACTVPVLNDPNNNNIDCNYTMNAGNNETKPVTCINWTMMKTFCEWAGDGTVHSLGARRLLTEAEWERQARGNDKRIYPWGNTPPPSCSNPALANFDPQGNGGATSCSGGAPRAYAVGSFVPGASASGTLDAAGNVYEFVSDWYDSTYYASACAAGCTDPPGGTNASGKKVIRGGSWINGAARLRTAFRGAADPNGQGSGYTNVGGRCGGPSF